MPMEGPRLRLGRETERGPRASWGMARLVDLQWKFGVTSSTDEVQDAGLAFLQLTLAVEPKDGLGAGGGTVEHVSMELTLPEFYHFLSEIQKAKAVMDSY